MNLIFLISYIFFTVTGLLLIKANSIGNAISISINSFSLQFTWLFLLGCLCYIISFILWMVVVSKYDLSFIYPIATSVVFILVLVCSFIVLKEPITIAKIVACVLILIGIILLQIK